MDRHAETNPVDALNAYAAAQRWPFRGSTVLDFERAELNQLCEVWRAKAAGGHLPYRRDFDARALKPVLTNLVILERVFEDGARRYRVRLMGSELVRVMGEGTGRYLDQTIPQEGLTHWYVVYDTVLDAQTPFRFVTRFGAERVSYLTSESFVAPVLNAAGEPTMLMSCAYFQSKAAEPAG